MIGIIAFEAPFLESHEMENDEEMRSSTSSLLTDSSLWFETESIPKTAAKSGKPGPKACLCRIHNSIHFDFL